MNFKLNKKKLLYSLIPSIIIAVIISLFIFVSTNLIYGDIDNTPYAIKLSLIYFSIISLVSFLLIYLIISLFEKSIVKDIKIKPKNKDYSKLFKPLFYIFIGIVILIILIILIFVGLKLWINFSKVVLPSEEVIIYCDDDADCIRIQSSCCSCMMGGRFTSINKNYEMIWNKYNKQNCGACLAVISNHPSCSGGIPKCTQNECKLEYS